MKRFSKIYRFLGRKIRGNQQQDKQAHTTEQKQTPQAKPPVKPPTKPPAKPPTKRVLITYGLFSLVFIVLASAAWFFKGAEFLPEHAWFGINILNTDLITKPDDKETVVRTDLITKPDDKETVVRKEHKNNKPAVSNLSDPAAIDELQDKVKRVKDEIRQLNAELDTIRIKQYLASARYLIDARASPEQALAILQSARTYIRSHPGTPSTNMNALSQHIEHQITQLQQYVIHSPHQALTFLTPFIDRLHTRLDATLKPSAEQGANIDQTDNSWIKGWLNKIYEAGKTLIKVEHSDYQYLENNRLLLKLLIAARSAVLLNEQEQFNIALQDASRLIDTMPEAPISQEQIQSILSLEISWQLPQMQQ